MKYPVHSPSRLEQILFDHRLVEERPVSYIYDVKGRASVFRRSLDPNSLNRRLDVHDPEDWDDKSIGSIRGEWFARVLSDCDRVLDIGCGDGWLTNYLAHTIPHVTGIDISPEQIGLARKNKALRHIENVEFHVAALEYLPFDDHVFDGVCFAGNVLTYRTDTRTALREIGRVLVPEGLFVFEQVPIDPSAPFTENILWFVDGGPPILHYGATVGLKNRSYFIYMKPESDAGSKLLDLAGKMSGELTEEQLRACEEIKRSIETGGEALQAIERVEYGGEFLSLSADDFVRVLEEGGFSHIHSWMLPDVNEFVRTLEEHGITGRLRGEDIVPILKALVKASSTQSGWKSSWVSTRKV